MSRLTGFVLLALAAVCAAQLQEQQFQAQQEFAPQQQFQAEVRQPVFTTPVPILRQISDLKPDGTFEYGYEAGDGTAAAARGYLKKLDIPDVAPAQVIEGQYSYTGTDGERYTITYVADENGFRAQGAHLPVPPPIPVEIQRSLEFIARTQAAQAAQEIPVRGEALSSSPFA